MNPAHRPYTLLAARAAVARSSIPNSAPPGREGGLLGDGRRIGLETAARYLAAFKPPIPTLPVKAGLSHPPPAQAGARKFEQEDSISIKREISMKTQTRQPTAVLLDGSQQRRLRRALAGRQIAACFGAGVDSTAMLVLLRMCDIRPTLVTFADLSSEKPETMLHLARTDALLKEWGWPVIDRCRKLTLPTTGYTDLEGNCLKNETLPSLAFGLKSCSLKWKSAPQDQFVMGVTKGPSKRPPHPAWLNYLATGDRIVKLIGYDCGPADKRRSAKLASADEHFDYVYPLQIVGWERRHCIEAISTHLGPDMVPIKSACFFCPASKEWELYWLAAHHPDLMERALVMERNALTGRHSRFDEVEFGASWESLVDDADGFPSSKTTVGLGRSFAWNQWARVNGVVDQNYRVLRTPGDVARFGTMADRLRKSDNALDTRAAKDIVASRSTCEIKVLGKVPDRAISLLTVNR